ncbi:MAG: hypothetical protein QOI77_1727 [Blastocatellia bacterium]|jgi:hypothetical protein|nr:hypothetical protein [Blastocatellia bacterium]
MTGATQPGRDAPPFKDIAAAAPKINHTIKVSWPAMKRCERWFFPRDERKMELMIVHIETLLKSAKICGAALGRTRFLGRGRMDQTSSDPC